MWPILQYNLLFSYTLALATVFKSNPKRLSISFHIPFETWKMHSKHFWPKVTTMTFLPYINLRIFNIYLLCIKQNRIKELGISQEQQKVFCWSKSNNEFTFYKKYLKIKSQPKFKYYIIFMSTIAWFRIDFRKSKLTSNWKNNFFTPFVTW